MTDIELETFDSHVECDGCGTPDVDAQLSYDHGVLVCQACVDGGIIEYTHASSINREGLIRFTVEYSLQKAFLRSENIIFNAFSDIGLKPLKIDYSSAPFGITVQLSMEDAMMFKLKKLDDTILRSIRFYGF